MSFDWRHVCLWPCHTIQTTNKKRVLVSIKKVFRVPVPSQCWKMIEMKLYFALNSAGHRLCLLWFVTVLPMPLGVTSPTPRPSQQCYRYAYDIPGCQINFYVYWIDYGGNDIMDKKREEIWRIFNYHLGAFIWWLVVCGFVFVHFVSLTNTAQNSNVSLHLDLHLAPLIV